MQARKQITRDDLLPMSEYGEKRRELRARSIALKKPRRVEVGPFATFYFENYETMLAQIHEMLWIEQGGEEQVTDELAAYNPLIPQGSELVATLMLEIDDPVRRATVLKRLSGIENTISLKIGDAVARAVPDEEDGVERTKEDGKTSSIHFLHFPLDAEQAAAFRAGEVPVVLEIAHEHYHHMAGLPAESRAALAGDLEA